MTCEPQYNLHQICIQISFHYYLRNFPIEEHIDIFQPMKFLIPYQC